MRCTLLLTVAILAHSEDSTAEVAIWGAGSATCGNFAESYKSNPELTEHLYFAWAQGFMSGINTVRLKMGEALTAQSSEISIKSVDLSPEAFGVDEQQSFLRQFCDERPLASYMQGVMELFDELQERGTTQ